jgi:hypothetical protein
MSKTRKGLLLCLLLIVTGWLTASCQVVSDSQRDSVIDNMAAQIAAQSRFLQNCDSVNKDLREENMERKDEMGALKVAYSASQKENADMSLIRKNDEGVIKEWRKRTAFTAILGLFGITFEGYLLIKK